MRFLIERKLNEEHMVQEYKGFELDMNLDRDWEGETSVNWVTVSKDGKNFGDFKGLRAARVFVDKEYFKSMKARLIRAIESMKFTGPPSCAYYTSVDGNFYIDSIEGDPLDTYDEAVKWVKDNREESKGILFKQLIFSWDAIAGNQDFQKYIKDTCHFSMFFSNYSNPFDFRRWEVYPYLHLLDIDGDLADIEEKRIHGIPFGNYTLEDIKRPLIKALERELPTEEISWVKNFIKDVEREED